MSDQATWLPNLVGGVSIWKLAVDLNEAKFFDGRLLVPETEGSESLPVTVRWDLTGLLPLAEAQSKYPGDAAQAALDFKACLDRVAKVFATPNSGFDKYKDAFTVPSLEAAGGANYFYSPEKKKLFVINWGASPRDMGGKAEYVFGWQDWSRVLEGGGAGTSAAAIAAASAEGAAAVASAATAKKDEPKKEKEEEKPKKKADDKPRAWWAWPLFVLLALALVLLAFLLFRSCEEQKAGPGADAATESAAASDAAAEAAAAADAGADADAAADAAAAADADAGADAASTDGGDAGADAGKDAGKDSGLASNDDDGDDGDDGPGSSGGVGSSGGPVVVTIGPAGTGTNGAKSGPHRRHFQKEAVKWRVATGNDKVSRTEQAGRRFDVWLGPGRTFEGVRVEWQDAGGKWHVH